MESEAVQILREIRDEVRQTNARLDQTNARLDQSNARLDQTVSRLDQTVSRLDQTVSRLDQTDAHLGVIETTVLELAEQQRFAVRHLKSLAERDHRLDENVLDLQRRVERIEERLGPG